jgi:hypothetical protein
MKIRKEIIAREGQNLIDIALQEYGSLEGLDRLIKDNSLDDGYNTIVTNGQELVIKQEPTKEDVVQYLEQKGVTIATASPQIYLQAILQYGQLSPIAGGSFSNDFNFDFY